MKQTVISWADLIDKHGKDLVECSKGLRLYWLSMGWRIIWKYKPELRCLIDDIRHDGARHAGLMVNLEALVGTKHESTGDENNLRFAIDLLLHYVRMAEYIIEKEAQ